MKNSKRLLILDDEKDVATTISMMAELAGFEALDTNDTEVFLEKVTTWSPTHVALDLQLNGADGIDVIRKLAKMGSTAIVIIISGLGTRILDSSARIASESGLRIAGVLAKPFSRAALNELLAVDILTANEEHKFLYANSHSVSMEQLSAALQAGVFTAHFQPKISFTTGELSGFECLARWPQHDGSMIPPDQFITLAEKTGLIDKLTRQVYRYALANLPIGARKTRIKFALNISPINLIDDTFPDWLFKQCREHGVATSQIILEVTETASMDNPLILLENLTQFRIRGFQLSIDDFGVGYSSLVQLARLPFSELKIDQMFVKTLQISQESQKIVTAVVGLGKSLGLNVVAEGVEDEWALHFLQSIGCDEAQGYFIAKPMDSLKAANWERIT